MSEINTDNRKISYSLFTPKKTYEHRFWDKDREDLSRYWFNIPAIHAINKFLFPDYKNFFYIDEETSKNPLFSFLKNVDSCNYSTIRESYEGHEPSFWRINPLWENNVSIFMSKDIDSIVNRSEYKCYIKFLKSEKLVCSIRSHENHYGFPCRMLMGLSSFKSSKISKEIKKTSLCEFKKSYHVRDSWDNDQLTLINAFTNNQFFASEFFLDFRVNKQRKRTDVFCSSLSEEDLDVPLSEEKKDLFNYIEKNQLSDWAGQPTDVRGKHLMEICSITENNNIIEIIKDLNLSSFYL